MPRVVESLLFFAALAIGWYGGTHDWSSLWMWITGLLSGSILAKVHNFNRQT